MARWEEIERLYHAALKRDAGERAAFLREACGGAERLRHEVESLLAQASAASGFLNGPAREAGRWRRHCQPAVDRPGQG